MRRYAQTLTVQRATLTDDGLGTSLAWANDGTITGTFLPASRGLLERAQLLGVRATHSLLIPRGLGVTPNATRFVMGSSTYEVRDVIDGPRFSNVLVEVTG